MTEPVNEQNPQDLTSSGEPNEKRELETEQEYADRCKFFLNDLDSKCDAENIKTAIAIIIDPKFSRPLVYIRGHAYNTTFAACQLARQLKQQLEEDLSV